MFWVQKRIIFIFCVFKVLQCIACRYTCIKKHSSFSFIAVLFVQRLSEHERPGAIGILKAGVRVSDVT